MQPIRVAVSVVFLSIVAVVSLTRCIGAGVIIELEKVELGIITIEGVVPQNARVATTKDSGAVSIAFSSTTPTRKRQVTVPCVVGGLPIAGDRVTDNGIIDSLMFADWPSIEHMASRPFVHDCAAMNSNKTNDDKYTGEHCNALRCESQNTT